MYKKMNSIVSSLPYFSIIKKKSTLQMRFFTSTINGAIRQAAYSPALRMSQVYR